MITVSINYDNDDKEYKLLVKIKLHRNFFNYLHLYNYLLKIHPTPLPSIYIILYIQSVSENLTEVQATSAMDLGKVL